MDVTPDKSLDFAIITNKETTYHKQVRTVSSLNEKGPFDILPQHTNFITLIHTVVTVHEDNGNKRDIAIGTAVMHVMSNSVRVYVGFGE